MTLDKFVISKLSSSEDYKMPTAVYYGRNSALQLPELLNKLPVSNILIVTGSHFQKSDVLSKLSSLVLRSKKLAHYKGTIKKSDLSSVNRLVVHCRKNKYDAVVGIGGGAVMDSAKIAAVLLKNEGELRSFLENSSKVTKPGVPFIAIPTTAGTGSEVTPWAVVWGKKKYSVSSPDFMFPSYAIIDPSLTDSCPAVVTASAGIDALCQAIESFWNINHNPISDEYALDAIQLILKNLPLAVTSPKKNIRDRMSLASLFSGMAFSNTQTTICHSLSYPITIHWGISHGQATSVTLPLFIKFFLPKIDKKRREIILKRIHVESEEEFSNIVLELMKNIGLKTTLSQLGIGRSDIDIILREGADPSRIRNSPIVPSSSQLHRLLSSIY